MCTLYHIRTTQSRTYGTCLQNSTAKTRSMCMATNAMSDDDKRGPVKQRVSV